MKITKLALVISCVFLLANCGKEDTLIPETEKEQKEQETENPNDSENVVYFTYESNSLNENADEWIILHDQNGDILEYRKVVYGERIGFKVEKDKVPESVTATKFFYFLSGGGFNPDHSLVTYANLESGSIWNRNHNFRNNPNPIIGDFNIRVSNIMGGVRDYSISNSYGNLNTGSTDFEGTAGLQILSLGQIPLYENETYILSLYDNQDNLRYVMIENPVDGMEYEFAFEELPEYDSYFELDNLPENTFSMFMSTGYASEQPDYNLYEHTVSRDLTYGKSNAKVGYLDTFKTYRTYFGIKMDGYSYGYSQMGDKIEELTILPKPSFTIVENSVYNFEFASDQTFIKKTAKWSYNVYGDEPMFTRWTVISPAENPHKIGELPQEILMNYPDFNLDKIELQHVDLFTKSTTVQKEFNSFYGTYVPLSAGVQEVFTMWAPFE
ncbi:hypothetical protein [Maribacter halichondriae]|uniref:hypothetical protein n=1 Tax=Maribacter halichondriae TaxID=2980554 RepID=UPI0023593D0A|nr:hypothetical protein [Maribacter sp. Hal144]